MVMRGTGRPRVQGSAGSSTRRLSGLTKGLQSVADDRRLLEDLLLHEVAVLSLADQRPGKRRQLYFALDLPALGVANLRTGAVQHHPIAFLEIADAVGQRRQRQGIGAQIHLAVAVAHRQRAAFAGAEHQVMVPGKDDGEREGPLEAGEGRTDGLLGGLLLGQILADQVDDDLRVGLGLEAVAGRLQLPAQLLEVLDNAVVDHRQMFVGVRVGVGFARPAMGGPAGVADADGALDRRRLEQGLQIVRACPRRGGARSRPFTRVATPAES